jgi:hypothetical protein
VQVQLHSLNLGTRRRWVVSFMPRPLYRQEKIRQYSLNESLRGPQTWSGCFAVQKISCPCGEGNTIPQLGSLYWVHYLSLHSSTEKTNILTYDTVTVINRHTALNRKKICGHLCLNVTSTWQVWYSMQQRLLPGGSLIFNCFCDMRRHSILASRYMLAVPLYMQHKNKSNTKRSVDTHY